MPVPPDIKEAVRKDYYNRVERLNARSVFDTRTNMMRARVMMMIQPDRVAGGGARRASESAAIMARLTAVTPSAAAAPAAASSTSKKGGPSGTPLAQPAKRAEPPATAPEPTSPATSSPLSPRRKLARAAEEHDPVVAKSKFDARLMARLDSVNTGLHPAELYEMQILQQQQQQQLLLQSGGAKAAASAAVTSPLAARDPIRKQFVSRNAFDAAVAVDPRAAEKRKQAQQQNLQHLRRASSAHRDQQSGTAADELAQQREQRASRSTGGVARPTSAIPKHLVDAERAQLAEEEEAERSFRPAASSKPQQQQQRDQKAMHAEDDDDEEDDDGEGDLDPEAVEKQRRAAGLPPLTKEELAAKQARRVERRRQRVLAARPISADDLRLNTTSGWMQRCAERCELEDDGDDFAHRTRLRERDERFRAKEAAERYKKGSMRPPGAESMLKVGAAGFFRPVTLLDAGGGVAAPSSHPQQTHHLLPALPEDVSQMSACDDRRHRMELRRARVLSAERQKLIGKAGAELLGASPGLISSEWAFAHSSGPDTAAVASSGGSDGRRRSSARESTEDFLRETAAQRAREADAQQKRQRRLQAGGMSSSSSSSSSSASSSSDNDDESEDEKRRGPFAEDPTADGATLALGPHQKRKFESAMTASARARQQQRGASAGSNGSKSHKPHKSKASRGRSPPGVTASSAAAANTDMRAVQEAQDLLESATVCACEMIVGGLNNAQHRTTDATVIKNVLKRSLVVLAPRIRRAAAEAKQRQEGEVDRRRADGGGGSDQLLARQLQLLRTWLKGCEVWVAMELGLDTHAGFFSVADAQHLQEFCALYARTKQIAQRNTEALMRRWQQQRDILTDPSTLMAMTPDRRDGEDERMTRLLNGAKTADPAAPARSSELPANLASFFTSVQQGRTTFGDSTLNAAARETSSKYFDTLQRFGVLPRAKDPKLAAHQQHMALSSSAARLKQMLRRFAHCDDDDDDSSKNDTSAQGRGHEDGDHDDAQQASAAAMVNVFHPSWLRSITGGATPADEMPAREATVEAHDTVLVLDLFIALLGAQSQQFIREEIQHALDYFHHDTAPDNGAERALVRSPAQQQQPVAAHVHAQEQREKAALREVHSRLLHSDAATERLDRERIAQLRKAIDRTDAWIHVAEEHSGVVAKHLSTQCGRPNSAVAAALAAKERAKAAFQQGAGGGDDDDGDSMSQSASIPAGSGAFSGAFSGGDDARTTATDNTDADAARSVAEERARATALQKLAHVWKQLYVPFQLRMELLEKYRNEPVTANVVRAEQRYSECLGAVTKRESLIAAINEFASASSSSPSAAALAAAAAAKEESTAAGSPVGRPPAGGAKSGGSSPAAGSAGSALRPARGGAIPGGIPEVDGAYQAEAEARRQRTAKKQQLLADFTAATQMCDAAIEKLASVGEQLYYHQVIYSVKMKDDLAGVLKVLRAQRD